MTLSFCKFDSISSMQNQFRFRSFPASEQILCLFQSWVVLLRSWLALSLWWPWWFDGFDAHHWASISKAKDGWHNLQKWHPPAVYLFWPLGRLGYLRLPSSSVFASPSPNMWLGIDLLAESTLEALESSSTWVDPSTVRSCGFSCPSSQKLSCTRKHFLGMPACHGCHAF